MRFIFCLCCALAICSLVFAQPLTVEWEGFLFHESDSSFGLSCYDVIEQPLTHDLFLFGSTESRLTPYDSAYAWLGHLGANGDDLWMHFQSSQNRGWRRAIFREDDQFVAVLDGIGTYVISTTGEVLDSLNVETCDGWIEGPYYLATGPEGETYEGVHCYHYGSPAHQRDAIVTCFSQAGDALWTHLFWGNPSRWILGMQPLSGGRLLLRSGDYPVMPEFFVFDPMGEIMQQFPAANTGDFLIVGEDTVVTVVRRSDSTVMFRKYTMLNEVLVEREIGLSYTGDPVLRQIDSGFLIVSSYGTEVLGVSENGDSLWSQSLGIDALEKAMVLYDGGLLFVGWDYDLDGHVHVVKTSAPNSIGSPSLLPSEFTFFTPYPNPFNATTTLTFALPRALHTTIDIFDVQGRFVERVADKTYDAGEHQVSWNAASVASGIYFAEMQAATQRATQKLLLLK